VVAARQPAWERTRPAAVAVMVLMAPTLVATLMHLDRFDLRSPFGWVWLAGYAGLPTAILGFVVLQRRTPRVPSPPWPLPAWLSFTLAFYGVGLVAMGLALFLEPEATAARWPWELTPLTARAVAAWVHALGAGVLAVAWEDDRRRFGPLAAMFVAAGALQLVAVARYGSEVDWGDPYGWVYVGLLVGLVVLGALGLAWLRAASTLAPSTT